MSETQRAACIERLLRAQAEFKNAIDGVKKAGGDQRGAAIAHTHVDTAGLWAHKAAEGIPVENVQAVPSAPVPLPEETTPPVPPLAPVIEELPPAAATGPAAPEDVGN